MMRVCRVVLLLTDPDHVIPTATTQSPQNEWPVASSAGRREEAGREPDPSPGRSGLGRWAGNEPESGPWETRFAGRCYAFAAVRRSSTRSVSSHGNSFTGFAPVLISLVRPKWP